jgi:hypothetical protein
MEKLLIFGLGMAVPLVVGLVIYIIKAKRTLSNLVNGMDDLTHVIDRVQDNYDRRLDRVEEGLTREIEQVFRTVDNISSQKKKK